jgi:enediyne biosynthesis protein E4
MIRAAVLLVLLTGCGKDDRSPVPTESPAARPNAPFAFVDTGAEAGLRSISWCGRPEKPHILESGGTGLAAFDYDGDGDLDLYLVNGWRLEGTNIVERTPNALYRNRGDGTFEDVTEQAGVGDTGWGCGVATGDYDGDGDMDLFVTNFGPDVLYRNNGDGTFSIVPEGPGIDGWSTGAVFFDADGDGDLDIYVAAYIDCTLDEVLHAERTLPWQQRKVMRGPFGFEGLANRFFEQTDEGRFVDSTKRVGLMDVGRFFSFGVAAADLDGDLDLDLYVANDSNPNYLYENDGTGKFRDVGLWSGAAFDANGQSQAGMGIAVGDYDGDGLCDLFVTNFEKDTSTLYHNLGNLAFADVSAATRINRFTYAPLSWGTVFADFDLDGDLDLFVANGHIYPQADDPPSTGTSFKQTNLLLANDSGIFTDRSEDSGPGLKIKEASHGVAAGDFDGDGDVDLAIANVDAAPTLLRNDTVRRGTWLLVEAPGAVRVEVQAGDRRWVRPQVIGGSFLSASDPRFHFGLGEVQVVDEVTAIWADGSRKSLSAVTANAKVQISR